MRVFFPAYRVYFIRSKDFSFWFMRQYLFLVLLNDCSDLTRETSFVPSGGITSLLYGIIRFHALSVGYTLVLDTLTRAAAAWRYDVAPEGYLRKPSSRSFLRQPSTKDIVFRSCVLSGFGLACLILAAISDGGNG